MTRRDGTIYVIRNTVNGKCYVGQTMQSMKARLHSHLRTDSAMGRAFRKYGADGFDVLEFSSVPENFLDYVEVALIARMRTAAPGGYNMDTGGNKNKHHLPESLAKISARMAGKNHPLFGKHHSAEAKAKMRTAQKGHPATVGFSGRTHSDESKRRMSARHIGTIPSEAALMKMRDANLGEKNPRFGKPGTFRGHHLSEEAKKTLSEKLTGYKHTREFCQRRSELTRGENHPMFGKHHSEVTKAKMREARLAYWQKKQRRVA